MKQSLLLTASLLLAAVSHQRAAAQAFTRGSLLVSISEGSTHAHYTTEHTDDGTKTDQHINGDRDPLTIEYGLSRHWGIGLNMGGDVLHVNPSKFYNINDASTRTQVITSEFTIDANYHYFVTKRTDISAFGSAGLGGVRFKGRAGDAAYQYDAGGGILRIGTKVKYYIFKRVGVMAMLSAYTGAYSPEGDKENTIASRYHTNISGYAIEFGICGRILK